MSFDASSKAMADRVADDVAGAFTMGLAYIGDKLGLFAALAALGKASSASVAQKTGLHERYVREWLNAMVASEYLEHDPQAGAYFMTPDQTAALVEEGSRSFVAGAFQFALPSLLLAPRLIAAFQGGGGIPFADLPAERPLHREELRQLWKLLNDRARAEDTTGQDEIPGSGDNTIDLSIEDLPEPPPKGHAPMPGEWRPRLRERAGDDP